MTNDCTLKRIFGRRPSHSYTPLGFCSFCNVCLRPINPIDSIYFTFLNHSPFFQPTKIITKSKQNKKKCSIIHYFIPQFFSITVSFFTLKRDFEWPRIKRVTWLCAKLDWTDRWYLWDTILIFPDDKSRRFAETHKGMNKSSMDIIHLWKRKESWIDSFLCRPFFSSIHRRIEAKVSAKISA